MGTKECAGASDISVQIERAATSKGETCSLIDDKC